MKYSKIECSVAKITDEKPVKADTEMILDLITKTGDVYKDHNAILKEIAPRFFIAETWFDIPEEVLDRAEGVFSAGRLMQPFPLAGSFVSKIQTGKNRFEYAFSFGGISYYAMKYIHIRSPRKGAGRPRKKKTEEKLTEQGTK